MSDKPFPEDLQGWVTGGGGEGDPASSLGDIQDTLDSEIASFANFHTTTATLPSDATGRSNGVFSNPSDVEQYLDGGGLIFRDGDGTAAINPIVHVVRSWNEDWQDYLYYVYIKDSSE